MTTGPQEIVIGEVEISAAQETVQSPAQLIAHLQAHRVRTVKLRPLPGTGYRAIGQVIHGLNRAGIVIESVEMPGQD